MVDNGNKRNPFINWPEKRSTLPLNSKKSPETKSCALCMFPISSIL